MPVTDLRTRSRSRQLRSVTRLHLVLSILALSLAIMARTSAQNSSTAPGPIRVRKSATALTAGERRDFVEAVLALKRARSPYDPTLTYYDQFVQWHKDPYVCHSADHADAATTPMVMVHAGPMFLPWHRPLNELLRVKHELLAFVGPVSASNQRVRLASDLGSHAVYQSLA
jgi:hypothetical protein